MEGPRDGEGEKKKNPEFFGDARSLGSVVPPDKAAIEQEQEWSCGRDPRWASAYEAARAVQGWLNI